MGEVSIEERGSGVVLATIANPPAALMDDPIVAALEALAIRAQEDPQLTAIVLTGAHPERFVALAAGLRRERAEFLATITSAEAKRAMRAYVERFARSGELPAHDAEALKRALERGVFE